MAPVALDERNSETGMNMSEEEDERNEEDDGAVITNPEFSQVKQLSQTLKFDLRSKWALPLSETTKPKTCSNWHPPFGFQF